jgi:hypothetical protein
MIFYLPSKPIIIALSSFLEQACQNFHQAWIADILWSLVGEDRKIPEQQQR